MKYTIEYLLTFGSALVNIRYKAKGGEQAGTGNIIACGKEWIIFSIYDNGEVPVRVDKITGVEAVVHYLDKVEI